MSNTGKQSPLGVDVAGSLLQNQGFFINSVAESYMGTSKYNSDYTPGKLVNDTVLLPLTYAINDAYVRGEASKYFDPISIVQTIQNPSDKIITSQSTEKLTIGLPVSFSSNFGGLVTGTTYYISAILSNTEFQVSATLGGPTFSLTSATGLIFMSLSGSATYTIDLATYDALISIGEGIIPALGNSKSPYYVWGQTDDVVPVRDPDQPATTGYYVTGSVEEGQQATWNPYDTTNPNVGVTQWGFLRLYPLQAWNEFNWNGSVNGDTNFNLMPEYKDFTASFLASKTFIDYNNQAILSVTNSLDFLDGIYSNMDDLITANVTGVSLNLPLFGQDCINLGKAIDLSQLLNFGLPSVLLKTLKKNNAITPSLNLALLSSGLTVQDIEGIVGAKIIASKEQEKQMYGAFSIITGLDLQTILVILNCVTLGFESLADLLNVKKLFPLSYKTLTVPIYNTAPGPTNSKTYYLIFLNDTVNPTIINPPPGLINIQPNNSASPKELKTAGGGYYSLDNLRDIFDFSLVNPIYIFPTPDPTDPNDPYYDAGDPYIPGTTNDPFRVDGGNVEDPNFEPAKPSERGLDQTLDIEGRFDRPNESTDIPGEDLGLSSETFDRDLGTDVGDNYCPAPWIKITLSDMSTITAADIEIGMLVHTYNETTKKWGNYPVIGKSLSYNANYERWQVTFTNDIIFVGTHNHRVLTTVDWTEIKDLKTGDKVITKDGYIEVIKSEFFDYGDVVKITVQDAHTYLTEGFLSHNVKTNSNLGINDTNQSAGDSSTGSDWDKLLDQTGQG